MDGILHGILTLDRCDARYNSCRRVCRGLGVVCTALAAWLVENGKSEVGSLGLLVVIRFGKHLTIEEIERTGAFLRRRLYPVGKISLVCSGRVAALLARSRIGVLDESIAVALCQRSEIPESPSALQPRVLVTR